MSKPWSIIGGIVDWSFKFRLLVLALAAVVLFLGIGQLRKMAVDVYPEFGPVVVEVQSEALGLSAQEVAEMVTVPLEADLLSNVPFVDILSSKSVPGLSSIELVFEPGTELLKATPGGPGAPCRSHGGAARRFQAAPDAAAAFVA